MTATVSTAGPILACYDGSPGSHQALATSAELLGPRSVVILTVWESLASQLSAAGGFGGLAGIPNEAEADGREEAAARAAAADGAARARERGFDATFRIEQMATAVWLTIVEVADEIGAQVIVCGSRGRSGLHGALLGSTSHGVLRHAHRPVLIAPQPDHTY